MQIEKFSIITENSTRLYCYTWSSTSHCPADSLHPSLQAAHFNVLLVKNSTVSPSSLTNWLFQFVCWNSIYVLYQIIPSHKAAQEHNTLSTHHPFFLFLAPIPKEAGQQIAGKCEVKAWCAIRRNLFLIKLMDVPSAAFPLLSLPRCLDPQWPFCNSELKSTGRQPRCWGW